MKTVTVSEEFLMNLIKENEQLKSKKQDYIDNSWEIFELKEKINKLNDTITVQKQYINNLKLSVKKTDNLEEELTFQKARNNYLYSKLNKGVKFITKNINVNIRVNETPKEYKPTTLYI